MSHRPWRLNATQEQTPNSQFKAKMLEAGSFQTQPPPPIRNPRETVKLQSTAINMAACWITVCLTSLNCIYDIVVECLLNILVILG